MVCCIREGSNNNPKEKADIVEEVKKNARLVYLLWRLKIKRKTRFNGFFRERERADLIHKRDELLREVGRLERAGASPDEIQKLRQAVALIDNNEDIAKLSPEQIDNILELQVW